MSWTDDRTGKTYLCICNGRKEAYILRNDETRQRGNEGPRNTKQPLPARATACSRPKDGTQQSVGAGKPPCPCFATPTAPPRTGSRRPALHRREAGSPSSTYRGDILQRRGQSSGRAPLLADRYIRRASGDGRRSRRLASPCRTRDRRARSTAKTRGAPVSTVLDELVRKGLPELTPAMNADSSSMTSATGSAGPRSKANRARRRGLGHP
jgi:hypothetical protein